MKLLKKGIAKNKKFIRLTFQCKNGIDTYDEDFDIVEKTRLFVGYGFCERKPDFYITIKDVKYACFWQDTYAIIGNNKCFIVDSNSAD